MWAHNGREIFYLADEGQSLWVAGVRTDPDFAVESREMLLDWGPYSEGVGTGHAETRRALFDVAPDDERFLAARVGSIAPATGDILVQNFFEELRRVVPKR